jgi:hypothetical protein
MPSALLPESNQAEFPFRMLDCGPPNAGTPARVCGGSSHVGYCDWTSREHLGQESLRVLDAMRGIKSDSHQQGNSGKPRTCRFIRIMRFDA